MTKFLKYGLTALLLLLPLAAQAQTTAGSYTTIGKGGTGASLTDPNADKIFFWDNSKGSIGGGEFLALPAAGLTISTTNLQLANDLAGLEGLSSTGLAVRTATDTWTVRTLQGTTNQIAISNNDGVSGNPTLSLDADIACLGALTTAADKIAYYTGSGTCALTDFTSTARSLVDDTSTSAMRTTLGLAIGTDVQAFDADLAALAANSTDGLWAHTGAGTGAARTLTAPAAGFTITNPAGIAGNPTFVLANDLSGVEGLAANGIATRTATDTWTVRTITGTANQITLTNGDGVSGNPTVSLPADVQIPTIITAPNTGLHVLDTDATHDLIIKPGSNLTADRTFTLTTGDVARTLDISAADVTISSFGASLIDDAANSNARTTLGLVIGTDVQAQDAELSALAGLTSAADALPYFTGSGTASTTTLTTFGRSLIDDAANSNARTTLGLVIGTDVQAFDSDLTSLSTLFVSASAAGPSSIKLLEDTDNGAQGIIVTAPSSVVTSDKTVTFQDVTGTVYVTGGSNVAIADGGTNADDAATARTNLGVAIGTDVQAFDSDLSALAGIASTGLYAVTGSGTGAVRTLTAPSAGITVSNGNGVSGNPTLALADDLNAVEGLSTNGIAARTATSTWTTRTITAPAAGISISNGDGVSGNPTLSLTNDLSGVEGLASNGMAARTATDTWAVRTITGTANEITLTNGDGVSGNPTVSIPSAVTFTGKTITGGTYSGPATSGIADIGGAWKLSGTTSPAQITAAQNDYAPSGICSTASTFRISTDASRNITGLGSPAAGCIATFHNIGSTDVVFTNADTGSAAANRFDMGANVTLTASQSATFRYDGTSSRWRVIAVPGSGGGGGSGTVTSVSAGNCMNFSTISTSGSVAFDANSCTNTETAPDTADLIAMYDVSGTTDDKITLNDLWKVVNTFSAETSVDTADVLPLYDASASTADKATVNQVLRATTTFTAETAVDTADELLLIDTSAGTADKATVNNLFKGFNTFTEDTSPDPLSDFIPEYDASGSAAVKTKLGKAAAGKHTIYIPSGSLTPNTTNGCVAATAESATNKIMSRSCDFADGATTLNGQFMTGMPKSWDEGTITARFDWTATSGTGNVVWQLRCVAVSDDDPLDAAFGTAGTVTDGITATGDVMQSGETGSITIAGTPAANDNVWCQILRDPSNASDTFSGTAKLLGVRILYTTDTSVDN